MNTSGSIRRRRSRLGIGGHKCHWNSNEQLPELIFRVPILSIEDSVVFIDVVDVKVGTVEGEEGEGADGDLALLVDAAAVDLQKWIGRCDSNCFGGHFFLRMMRDRIIADESRGEERCWVLS